MVIGFKEVKNKLQKMRCLELLYSSSVNKYDNLRKILENLDPKPKKALEIGTQCGISTIILASICDKVNTFDIKYQKDAEFVWELFKVSEKINYWIEFDRAAIKKRINTLEYDFVFIDAVHNYENVKADYDMVKNCKSILFHDNYERFPGIQKFLKEKNAQKLAEFGYIGPNKVKDIYYFNYLEIFFFNDFKKIKYTFKQILIFFFNIGNFIKAKRLREEIHLLINDIVKIFILFYNFLRFNNDKKINLKNLALLSYKLFKSRRSFKFQKKTYYYFYHAYYRTWTNEKAVEIPIFYEILKKFKFKTVVEIGNVLSHYFHINHKIIDLDKNIHNINNQISSSFYLNKKYDLIFSISILNHLNWQGIRSNSDILVTIIEKLKKYLTPKGKIIVSFSLSFDKDLINLLKKEKLRLSKIYCLIRTSEDNRWKEIDYQDLFNRKYNIVNRFSNKLIIGIIENENEK